MKETSETMKSNCLPCISSDVRLRKSLFSKEVTRSSCRRLSANCCVPTSTATTCAAPCCKAQSVKPPVELPMSSTHLSRKSNPKVWMAFSSFSPPMLTYLLKMSMTSTYMLLLTSWEALVAMRPSIMTVRCRMAVWAFSREGKSCWSTRYLSNRMSVQDFGMRVLRSARRSIRRVAMP